MATGLVIDVGDGDFEREVLARSREVPVVVDFWAPWCAPCRVLGPVLERLAAEHDGAVVLAKVNVDEARGTAEAFRIQSIPAVKGFRDGAVVAEFVGAQPEPVVRRFLSALLPTEADRLAAQGEADAAAGRVRAAEVAFRGALEREPRQARALLGLARLHAAAGRADEALQLLERVAPGSTTGREAERLAAELRTLAAGDGDEATVRARIAASADDLEARLTLGRLLASAGRYAEALAELLAVVQRDAHFADDGARKAMLDVFAVLGPDDPLTERFRSELAKALFR